MIKIAEAIAKIFALGCFATTAIVAIIMVEGSYTSSLNDNDAVLIKAVMIIIGAVSLGIGVILWRLI